MRPVRTACLVLLIAVAAVPAARAESSASAPVEASLGGQATATGPLTGRELTRILPGRFAASALGFHFDFTLARGGKVQARYGEYRDKGSWRVKGDQLCISLDKWFSGSERCAAISARGGNRYATGIVSITRSDVN